MGEYARLYGSGERVKIGTCEDLLYLRFDQLGRIWDHPDREDTDPRTALNVFRFRFPWPDEDGTDPGAFEDPFRRMRVDGAVHPEGVDHDTIQFKCESRGYLVSLPCPEGSGDTGEVTVADGEHPYRVGRNGFKGSAFISQQAVRGGRLVTIAECACGAKYRLETLEHAAPWITAVRDMALEHARRLEVDRMHHGPDLCDPAIDRYREIANRMEAGYRLELPA